MIEIKVGKNVYKIESIKIRDYYKMRTDLTLKGKEAEFTIVSALSGCPIADLKKMPLDKWETVSIALELMILGAFKQGREVQQHFRFKEVDYALVDLNRLTIGEFSDLDVLVTSENSEFRLHEILAILYRPVVGKTWKGYKIAEYDTEGFEERSKLFLDLPLHVAQGVNTFFLRTVMESTKAIKISSKSMRTQDPIVMKAQEILTQLQDNGITHSSNSPEKIYSKLIELQSLAFGKLSTTWLTRKTESLNKKGKIREWLNNITN